MAKQTEKVYQQLKERIEHGYYAPAENLTEAELSSEFDVSRNTVKKALLMLESDGYVTLEPNKGTKVRSYSKTEVLEFLELREELEGFIVRLSMPYFKSADIREMESVLKKQEACKKANDLFGYSALNQDFHGIIYRVCPNKTAVNVVVKLKKQMKKYNSKTVLIPGRTDQGFKEHQSIVQAIRSGNAEEAENCMRLHIHNVREIYNKYYSILF